MVGAAMALGQIEPSEAAGSDPPDRRVATLAARQHGVVTRRQLLGLGVSRHGVQRRLETGLLHCLHAGVYAVGHRRVTQHGRWLAAVLACGDGALLSHRSAAELWGLTDRIPGPVHVSVTRGRAGRRPGIVVHRPRELAPRDRARHWSIPLTSPSRTLLDIAAKLGPSALRDAADEARRRRLLEPDRVLRLCEQSRGRKGTAQLHSLVARYRPLPETRSWPETRFLRLLDDAGIARPAVNVPLLGFEVDCLWPKQRLVVELDSYGFHGDPESFESDRRRDVALQLAGYQVLRFTRDQVVGQPGWVVAQVRAALRSPRSPGGDSNP